MKTILLNRLKKLQKELKPLKLDAFFLEDPLDLFYFTGLKLSRGKLLVLPQAAVLIVDSRYIQMAQESSPVPCLLDGSDTFTHFCEDNHVKQLGFNGGRTFYDQFLSLQTEGRTFVSATSLLKRIRSVKDDQEIALLKKSAQLLWKGFEFLKGSLQEGVTERALAKRFEIFCLEQGAERLSFEPIIAFGAHSAMPHYRAGGAALKVGDAVLIDIGVVFENYYSDMTRVLFFQKEDPYLAKMYQIVKRAQKSALALCRPGTSIKEIDLAAREVFREENVEGLFTHSLGHGVGLEIHEFPRLQYDREDKDVILEEGMVFTVEPGLYVPGVGGVRYEDTIVITKNGYDNFYPLLNK